MRTYKRQELLLKDYGGGFTSRFVKKLGLTLVILSSLACGFIAVIVSPFLLQEVYTSIEADWTRLSEIGQAYGAASAILTILALSGVVLSLFLQARQAKAGSLQAVRQSHMELIRMALADPQLYLPCWDPAELPELQDRSRHRYSLQGKQRHGYTNLIMNYQLMAYEIKAIYEPELRRVVAGMFQGDVARAYWSIARHVWVLASAGTRRGRRFFRIVDEEYRKATARGDPLILSIEGSDPPHVVQHKPLGRSTVATAFACGALLGAIVHWAKRRS
jgi:Family of unknown function (DUF6082)